MNQMRKRATWCWCFLKSRWMLLCLALVLASVVRIYKLTTPLADWHSFRQSDTASVTREFVKHGYGILLPHYQDLSNIASGFDNPQGYRMVEFPIVNYAIARVLLRYPHWDLVVTSRLFSIGFSLISLIALFLIVVRLSQNTWIAFFTSLVFALLPYSVYYSRVILPEPAMVMCQLVSFLFFFLMWMAAVKAKAAWWKQLVVLGVSCVFLALALLLKPFAVFMLPVFGVAALYEFGWGVFKKWQLIFWGGLAVLPLIWWRRWILQFPSGIPVSDWLFNGNGIRLRPSWWWWLFSDRLGRLMMGHWGVVFLFLGAMVQKMQRRWSLFDWVTLTWVASMFGYLVVIATGNVQHDYYQTMLVPSIAVLFGRGLWFAIAQLRQIASPLVLYPAIALVLAFTAYFSWYEVAGYYHINNWAIVHAGQAADKLLPPDAKVIAPYMGDTAFLFQTNRTGWPIGFDLDHKIKLGASYYVTVTEDDEAKQLEKKYPVVAKTAEYVIIKLSK